MKLFKISLFTTGFLCHRQLLAGIDIQNHSPGCLPLFHLSDLDQLLLLRCTENEELLKLKRGSLRAESEFLSPLCFPSLWDLDLISSLCFEDSLGFLMYVFQLLLFLVAINSSEGLQMS